MAQSQCDATSGSIRSASAGSRRSRCTSQGATSVSESDLQNTNNDPGWTPRGSTDQNTNNVPAWTPRGPTDNTAIYVPAWTPRGPTDNTAIYVPACTPRGATDTDNVSASKGIGEGHALSEIHPGMRNCRGEASTVLEMRPLLQGTPHTVMGSPPTVHAFSTLLFLHTPFSSPSFYSSIYLPWGIGILPSPSWLKPFWRLQLLSQAFL